MRRRAWMRSGGGGGAPLVWTPPSAGVPLLAWYRADLGVTTATGVSGWADQSGNGDANRDLAQATAGLQPTLISSDAAYGGQPTISFAAQYLARAGAWSAAPTTPITIVVVGQITDYLSSIISSSTADMIYGGTLGYSQFYGPPALTSTGPDIAGPSVIMVTDDGATTSLYAGNLSTPASTDASVFQAAGGFDVGRGAAGIPDLTGKAAEVIIWGGALPVGDLTELKAYFNTTQAYGLSVT